MTTEQQEAIPTTMDNHTGYQLPALADPVRLGFDGKRATKNLTGLGNYSRWLIGTLAEYYPQNLYYVYTPAVSKANRIKKFLETAHVLLKKPANNFLWRSIGILKDLARDKINLYHGLSHEIPFTIQFSKIKSVVTIHDLIFLRYPQHYKLLDRIIYKFKTSYACSNADKIIAISEKTKADIIEFYHVPEHKIEVIYQSCDPGFRQLLSPEVKKQAALKYKLPQKYILYVGTIESRKNLISLAQAMKQVDESYHLVVIGRKTRYYSKVKAVLEANDLTKRAHFYTQMPFADLPAVYQNAGVFVLPSYYEGFGIPVIEALHSGIPVVAATGSCLEEAGGPHSLYVHPEDVNSLAVAINSVITDGQLAAKMIEKGLEYVQKFDDKQLTDQLMDCYLNLLEK